MKIRLFTAIILFCVLFAALMTSCRDNNEAVETDTDEYTETSDIPETESKAPDTETSPIETKPAETEVDESLREPVENEKAIEMIEFQYEKASEAMDWAKNGTLSADLTAEILTEDGRIFFPIVDTAERPELDGASITTFDSLSKYIKSIFARAIADDLIDLAKEHYAEIDGVLCIEAEFIDTEPEPIDPETSEDEEPEEENEKKVLKTEFFLSKFTDTLFRYTAKVTYEADESAEAQETENEDNIEYFDFIFENTGSGWYWTAFPELPQ